MGPTLPFSFAQNTSPTMNAFILLTACVAASQAQYALPAPYALHGAYHPYAVAAPQVTVKAAPAPIIAAAAPLNPSSQFQAQDEFGNLQYGYSNINSQKHEVGNTYGGVSGSYSYVDANGVVQTTNYIADALGFRVQATNLPVAPSVELEQPVHTLVQPAYNLVGPAPVEDTEEVKAAKAAFQAAFDEAANREKRSTPAATAVLPAAAPVATAPLIAAAPYAGLPHLAGLPYAGAYGAYPYAGVHAGLPYAAAGLPYAAPVPAAAAVVASAPATRDAELHTVKLNPGHAVAYRVY